MNPVPSESRFLRHREAGLLGLLTLAALAVRLLFLGRAQLWGDEILFVIRDAHPAIPVGGIYRHMLEGFSSVTHLPFPLMAHNLLIRALRWLFLGDRLSPFWFRLPAVLWGTATIPALFLLLRRRLPRPTAWLAAAWMAFGFFPVAYSREAYFYAPLMTLAALTLHFWLRGLEALRAGRRLPAGTALGLVLAGTAMAHSHVTGLLLQTLLVPAALAAGFLGPRPPPRRLAGAASLAALSALPLLAASPFLRVWMTEGIQSSMAPGTPLNVIFLDVAGKCFLGHLPGLNAAGAAVLALGLYALARAGSATNPAPRWMAGLALAFLLAIALLAHRSSYHVRYFTGLLPLLLTANACGIAELSRLAGRLPLLRRASPARRFAFFAVPPLALNLLLLPLFWWPTVRARDYAAVADWLNQHLPPGSAYLWESAYERRFVSEEPDTPFPTPDRLACWPMVHLGPEEHPILRRLQRQLLERYPDIPWIDCRHGQRDGMEFGDWEWPRTHFRRLALILNKSFAPQERFRVALFPLGRYPANETSIPIRFNAPSDLVAMDIEAGRPGSLFYPGWAFDVFFADETAQQYGRFFPGPEAPLQAASVQDRTGPAVWVAGVAVTTRRPGNVRLDLMRDREVLGSWTLPAGHVFHPVRSPSFPLPPGHSPLVLRAEAGASNEILAIWLERAALESPPAPTATRSPEPP